MRGAMKVPCSNVIRWRHEITLRNAMWRYECVCGSSSCLLWELGGCQVGCITFRRVPLRIECDN